MGQSLSEAGCEAGRMKTELLLDHATDGLQYTRGASQLDSVVGSSRDGKLMFTSSNVATRSNSRLRLNGPGV